MACAYEDEDVGSKRKAHDSDGDEAGGGQATRMSPFLHAMACAYDSDGDEAGAAHAGERFEDAFGVDEASGGEAAETSHTLAAGAATGEDAGADEDETKAYVLGATAAVSVVAPVRRYQGAMKHTPQTEAMHAVVHAEVEGQTPGMAPKNVVLNVAALVVKALQVAQADLEKQMGFVMPTTQQVVAAAVAHVPTDAQLLEHFEEVGAPPGHVLVGAFYSMQTLAGMLGALVELGLAKGTQEHARTNGKVRRALKWKEYKFACESFLKALIKHGCGTDGRSRSWAPPTTCWKTSDSLYACRGDLGYGPVFGRPKGERNTSNDQGSTTLAKLDSLHNTEWGWHHKRENDQKHRWTDTRQSTQPRKKARVEAAGAAGGPACL